MTALERSPEAAGGRARGERRAPGPGGRVAALGRVRRRRRAARFDAIVANPPYLVRGRPRRPPRRSWRSSRARRSSRGRPAWRRSRAIAAEAPAHLEPGGVAADGGGRGPGAGGRGRAGARPGSREVGRPRRPGGHRARRGRAGAGVSARRVAALRRRPDRRAASRSSPPTRSTAWRRALDVPAGVAALYALKGRPRSQPCQVLLYSAALLDEALAAPRRRAPGPRRAALLPGPATCLVPDPAGRYAAAAGRRGRARWACARRASRAARRASTCPWSPRAPTSRAGRTRRASTTSRTRLRGGPRRGRRGGRCRAPRRRWWTCARWPAAGRRGPAAPGARPGGRGGGAPRVRAPGRDVVRGVYPRT